MSVQDTDIDAVCFIPKAELHVHIEGTITPDVARRKAKEQGLTLDPSIFSADGMRFVWRDFADCVTRVYNEAASVIRSAQDYEDITYDYLARSAAENCLYAELIISPEHARQAGISYRGMVDAMGRAIDRARDDTGIEARMNATLVRHVPVEDLRKDVQAIIDYQHPYVTGLDLAGAEQAGDLAKFLPLFKQIKDATGGKMGWRVHAAEAAGPENAREALATGVLRIGHGVRAIEDKAVLADIVKKGTVLEICPTSNILAGIYPSFAAHPLRRLFDAGARVTINSDDPGLFGTTIGREYQIAHDEFGFSTAELRQITRTALEAAFIEEPVRKTLLQKLDQSGPVSLSSSGTKSSF